MFCAIYKSSKKSSMYLYVKNKDDFSSIPEALLEKFGSPLFVMMLDLSKRKKLAFADIGKVCEALKVQGFYLQLPPSLDDSLSEIRRRNYKIL